jgi:hypothetical protein
MKRFQTAYYFLFVLLVMGAFASMAQNLYGQQIHGWVAVIFGTLFAIQLFGLVQNDKKDWPAVLELTSLAILALLLGMRIFYIRFAYAEYAFTSAGILLVGVYSFKAVQLARDVSKENVTLARVCSIFYASLIAYILSMCLTPVLPSIVEPIGIIAFSLLVTFGLFNYYNRQVMYAGEKVSPVRIVSRSMDQSSVIVVLFILFTAYMGLTRISLIPKMYSNQFPQAYFNLVKEAERGLEKADNGKFKHEQFKAAYDAFVRKHKASAGN